MQHTQKLLEIMALLRDPQKGCPWDVEQDFASIAPHTLEEAYEVAEAIAENNMESLREELGDLLLQVVFHAQMAKEDKLFNFEDVAETICNKLVSRHPHVFGDASVKTAEEQVDAWEKLKTEEKKQKNKGESASTLEGVPLALPALTRALKLQKKAAKVGFDWPSIVPVFEKLEEEIRELKEALTRHSREGGNLEDMDPGLRRDDNDKVKEEIGDILFVCANLARHCKADPEEALRATNRKFEQRFSYIEQKLKEKNKTPEQSTLQEMDRLWDEAKQKAYAAKR